MVTPGMVSPVVLMHASWVMLVVRRNEVSPARYGREWAGEAEAAGPGRPGPHPCARPPKGLGWDTGLPGPRPG
ncbi:hypothetical protein ACE1SV_57440 [Streptomyces sp. E-15]